VIQAEVQQLWPDGSTRWVSETRMPLRDAAGDIVGTFGLTSDITARKEALEKLRQSEGRFRNLFNNSPDAIFVEDYQGVILDVNPAACRLQRRRRDELIGKNVLDLAPPSYHKIVQRGF